MLMVCHDLLVAPIFVDRAVLLAAGELRAEGEVAEVLTAGNIESAYGTRVEVDRGVSSVSATFPRGLVAVSPPAR